MSNCMAVIIGYMIGEQVYELLRSVSSNHLSLQPMVLGAETNFFVRDRLNPVLREWRSPDVPTRILQEMLLGCAALNIDIPPALILYSQQSLQLRLRQS